MCIIYIKYIKNNYSNFYFVARVQLLIPLERGLKSNIRFIFYFFDIINNTKVMVKKMARFEGIISDSYYI